MTIQGGCACRAVRFESTEKPVTTRVCWCRVCQYLGAGGATVNAMFRTAGFTVTGKTTSHRFVADSGNNRVLEFPAGAGNGGAAVRCPPKMY